MRFLILTIFFIGFVTSVTAQDKIMTDNANTQDWKPIDDAAAQKLKKYGKFKMARTSTDSNLLKSYIELYKHKGGTLYIIYLQQTYKLEKEKDSTYKLVLNPKDEEEVGPHPKWSDFLYCPIGKENGILDVYNADGEKMQEWRYYKERKYGKALWYNSDKEVTNTFIYRNDTLQQKK